MKPRARTTTSAKVQLVVEVTAGSWGPDCQIDQVYRQALQEATNKLAKLFHGSGVRIIGRPVVQAITTDMEQR